VFDGFGQATATWMYWAGSDLGGARAWAGQWTENDGWQNVRMLHDLDPLPPEVDGLTHRWVWDPDVSVDRDGNAVVAWTQSRREETGRQRLEIWSRRFVRDQGWEEAVRLDSESRAAGDPRVGSDATGRFVAVWTQGGGLRASEYELGCERMTGAGGQGGSGGGGGAAGTGPEVDLCEGVVCPNTECSDFGSCDPDTGTCVYESVEEDGTACSEGECVAGGCGRVGALACTEEAIRAAVEAGGGPHYFACDEPSRIVLSETLAIEGDVTMDGEGQLTIHSPTGTTVSVGEGSNVELSGVTLTTSAHDLSVLALGSLRVADSIVEGSNNYRGTVELLDTKVRRFGLQNSRGQLTLTRVDISADSYSGYAGGISNFGGSVTMADSTISGSGQGEWAPFDAGAIYNSHSFSDTFYEGVVIIERSTISGNRGRRSGAIYNNGATLTIRNSTISNNIAERGPSVLSWSWQGGPASVVNSTISGAEVEYECGSDYHGYAIGNRSGDLVIVNSTLAANARGGLDNRASATVTQSIIDGDCVQYGDDSATVSGGYNIVGGMDSCGFVEDTDLVEVSSVDLALGALADNGGPTMTHALGPGSVGIDAIPAGMCELDEDQRGEPRPAGGSCDVGAFEVQP